MSDVLEIVLFGVCWSFVAVVMLWSVFTEDRRGGFDPRFRPVSARRPRRAAPSGGGPSLPLDRSQWVLVATIDGAPDHARDEGQLVLRAWLAAWGADETALGPADVRSEPVVTEDGARFTQILVRSAALPRRNRHRLGS